MSTVCGLQHDDVRVGERAKGVLDDRGLEAEGSRHVGGAWRGAAAFDRAVDREPNRVGHRIGRAGSCRSCSSQHPDGRQRVDLRALDHPADLHELLRPVRHGEDAGPVGERRHAALGVEPRLEQAGAHLERRRIAGHLRRPRPTARARARPSAGVDDDRPSWISRTSRSTPCDRAESSIASRFCFSRSKSSAGSVRRSMVKRHCGRHDVEVRSGVDAAANEHDRALSCIELALDVEEPRQQRHRALDRVRALVLQPDVGGAAAHGHLERQRAAVAVPDDAAGRLRQEHADRIGRQQAAAASAPVPNSPPVSSSGTNSSSSRPRRDAGCPAAPSRPRTASTTSPLFMSELPRPNSVSPSIRGTNCPASNAGTTSKWPWKHSVGPDSPTHARMAARGASAGEGMSIRSNGQSAFGERRFEERDARRVAGRRRVLRRNRDQLGQKCASSRHVRHRSRGARRRQLS